VADLATALTDAGIDVVVASFEPIPAGADAAGTALAGAFTEPLGRPEALGRPRSWGAPGVPVARLPIVGEPGRRRPITLIDDYARPLVPFGVALAERWPFDLIHVQSGLPDGLAAAQLASRLAVPMLIIEHSSTLPDQLAEPEAVAGYREFLRPERRIAAVSRSLGRAIAGRIGVAASAIAVVPNAVTVDRFMLGSGSRDPDELLYLGSRRATKGIEVLLRAFAEARSERPRLRLRLIGDPGTSVEEERWAELASDLRLADSVTFEAPLDRGGVADALRRATALVHPSPRETFGTVAAEALATGTPVVTLPSGGVDEIVGHTGTHGEVADGIGPAELSRAIRRLLARRDSFDPRALRAHVEATSAAPVVAARTIALYEELLGRRRRASAGVDGTGSPGGTGRFVVPLVVGLDRAAVAGRVAALPAELAARLTVVTLVGGGLGDDAPGLILPPVERWVEADPEALHRERRLALGQPFARRGQESWWRVAVRVPWILARRVLLDRRRESLARESVAAAITGAWRTLADSARGGGPAIAPLAAADAEAAARALDEGAELAPGSLRWLADRWDGAGRP
jgi:glycosyltransferase involved in cell wall biosynthesis